MIHIHKYDNFLNEMVIGSKERIHNSTISNVNDVFIDSKYINQPVSHKPFGLWYGIGNSWINWVEHNMPEWKFENYYKLKIDTVKILLITNIREFNKFDEEYSKGNLIDWAKVSNHFYGIEINPYISQGVKNSFHWYDTWDVASGCIWDKRALISIKKINK